MNSVGHQTIAYYASMADDALLEAYAWGSRAYRTADVWQCVVNETARRHLLDDERQEWQANRNLRRKAVKEGLTSLFCGPFLVGIGVVSLALPGYREFVYSVPFTPIPALTPVLHLMMTFIIPGIALLAGAFSIVQGATRIMFGGCPLDMRAYRKARYVLSGSGTAPENPRDESEDPPSSLQPPHDSR